MKKKRWLAGYGSFLDWYIVENTPENQKIIGDDDGDEYETFAEAKRSLIEHVKQRINDDKEALKFIRQRRAK